ncbi:signal peptidase I [Ruminococcaceae bacterium OttesenSCG-928-L11]|nr:signal peptidase I [Ruminococcaceae bacterium OttesenSCG-928-L11]
MNEELNLEEKTGFSFAREAYDWVESAITALVFVVVIFTFVGMIISVNGSSMEPNLQHNDRLICVRMFSPPQYKDIVVITKPDNRNNPLIKRVIATSGQTVDFDVETGTVLVNGVALDEPYIAEEMELYMSDLDETYPLTVPEGHVFVMGDNRNNSWDSRERSVGPIDERYIFGRVLYRMMPYDKMGDPNKAYK